MVEGRVVFVPYGASYIGVFDPKENSLKFALPSVLGVGKKSGWLRGRVQQRRSRGRQPHCNCILQLRLNWRF